MMKLRQKDESERPRWSGEIMLSKFVRARTFCLELSLALISIPGIIGYDLVLGSFRLGRLQPFKFVWMGWLLCQGAWIFNSYRYRVDQLISRLWSGRLLLAALFFFDIFLVIGLVAEKGGDRGWSVFFSLLLGQCGALLTVLDEEFSVLAVLRGLGWATGILLFFGLSELFFPDSSLTQGFIRLMRDNGAASFQIGSTLSTSGLAEFSVRAFPLVVFFLFRSKIAALTASALVLLGLLTLEKNALLSFMFMGLIVIASGFARNYLKQLVGLAVLGIILVLAIQGPDKVFARYLGAWVGSDQSFVSQMAKRSLDERREFWRLGLRAVRALPVTGMGLDGFARRNSQRIVPLESSLIPMAVHCHNLLLEFAVSGGVFALIALMVCLVAFTYAAWVSSFRNWTVLVFLGGQFFSVMTDVRIYVSWLAITFFWFASIAWVQGKRVKEISLN